MNDNTAVSSLFSIRDKIALVTGGSRGIGAAIARAFAANGADVAVNYNTSVERANFLVRELEEAGVKAVAVQADVSCPAEVISIKRRLENKAPETFTELHQQIKQEKGLA